MGNNTVIAPRANAKPTFRQAATEVLKKFNMIVAGFWKWGDKGSYKSMVVDARTFDNLQKIEIGGTLIVKMVSDQTKEEKGSKFPDVFLEYMSVEETKKREAEYQAYLASKRGSTSDEF